MKLLGFKHFLPARSLGLLCALLATMCWACNYLISRLFLNSSYLEHIDEWCAVWIRAIMGALIFLPISFRVKEGGWGLFKENWKKDWWMFAFLAGCSVAEGAICFVALKYTTGARASLFANISPVFTLIISVMAAREVLNKRKVVGILLGLGGVVLAAFSRGGDMFSGDASMLTGDLLALVSGFFWALFTVFGGVITSRYSGAFCTAIYRICGIVYLLPVLWISNSHITFDLPVSVWLIFLYYAAVSGGISVWLWSIAQKYVEPAILGAFGYLSAFCATAFSLIFLEERFSINFIIALVLIIFGMVLAIRRK